MLRRGHGCTAAGGGGAAVPPSRLRGPQRVHRRGERSRRAQPHERDGARIRHPSRARGGALAKAERRWRGGFGSHLRASAAFAPAATGAAATLPNSSNAAACAAAAAAAAAISPRRRGLDEASMAHVTSEQRLRRGVHQCGFAAWSPRRCYHLRDSPTPLLPSRLGCWSRGHVVGGYSFTTVVYSYDCSVLLYYGSYDLSTALACTELQVVA